MSERPFVPPMPTVRKPKFDCSDITDEYRSEIKHSDYYRKQITKQKQLHHNLKRKRRSEWWKNNWISFLSLIFAIIAALPVIIQAICSILELLGS